MEINKVLFDNIDEAIVLFDKKLRIIETNRKFSELFGNVRSLEDIINKKAITHILEQLLIHESFKEPIIVETNRKKIITSTGFFKISETVYGAIFYVKEFDRKNEMKDPLTGVLNRKSLLAFLKSKINLSTQEFALLFLDLNKFKQVNDSYGHKIGDAILQSAIKRVQNVLRKEDIIGRYGGDEFLVAIDTTKKEHLIKIIEKIGKCISEVYRFESVNIDFLSVSIGVAFFPEDTKEPMSLVEKADEAMFSAKRNRKLYVFYKEIENCKFRNIKRDFLESLKNEDIFLKFQPMVESEKNEPVIVEALSRWLHILYDEIGPNIFLQIVKDLNMQIEFDKYVLQKTAKTLKKYNLCGVCISVNISSDFFNTLEFEKYIKNFLAQNGFLKNRLIIEITEESIIGDFLSAKEKILTLKEVGVEFAIDDFGTGFSSLSYLVELPIDYIKIDKSFIENIEKNRKIIRFIIFLAKSLGAKTIAEGVEREEQKNSIKSLGIDFIQGFYYYKPLFPLSLKKVFTKGSCG